MTSEWSKWTSLHKATANRDRTNQLARYSRAISLKYRRQFGWFSCPPVHLYHHHSVTYSFSSLVSSLVSILPLPRHSYSLHFTLPLNCLAPPLLGHQPNFTLPLPFPFGPTPSHYEASITNDLYVCKIQFRYSYLSENVISLSLSLSSILPSSLRLVHRWISTWRLFHSANYFIKLPVTNHLRIITICGFNVTFDIYIYFCVNKIRI